MAFSMMCAATVADVRLKRGKMDDSVVGVVIRFDAEDVPAEAAAAALGADNVDTVIASFFRDEDDDKERSARYFGMKDVRASGKWENHHTLSIHKEASVRVRKVNTIAMKPRAAGRFDMTFSVTIDSPPKGLLEQLANDLHCIVKIDLVHDRELFDAQNEEDSAKRAAGPAQVAMEIPAGSPLADMDDLPPPGDRLMTAAEYIDRNEPKTSRKAPKPGETDAALAALSEQAKRERKNKADRDRRAAKAGKAVKASAKPSSKASSTKAGRFGKKR